MKSRGDRGGSSLGMLGAVMNYESQGKRPAVILDKQAAKLRRGKEGKAWGGKGELVLHLGMKGLKYDEEPM